MGCIFDTGIALASVHTQRALRGAMHLLEHLVRLGVLDTEG